jgi:beta-glucosidase
MYNEVLREAVFMKIVPVLVMAGLGLAAVAQTAVQPELGHRSAPVLKQDGLEFKDLNRNGRLDVYEDRRRTPAERAKDLVSQMTLEEKAGAMMHGSARSNGPSGVAGMGSQYDFEAARIMIQDRKINSFITRLNVRPRDLAEQNNKLQEIAEGGRLGIPATISTDPRNHFQYTAGASVAGGGFSQWPETLGFAAIGDAGVVKRFADIARREYRAVGIHEALSPQADLSTEPRWSRINGTFGEDAELSKRLVAAYVEGFQNGGNGLNAGSVITIVKHWVGYGAQKRGFDSHNAYGKYAVFPGGNFQYHIGPFVGAFAAHVGGVMPTYSILQNEKLDGQPLEQVGAGFNRQLLTELLRGKYGFDGVILSDWGITSDCSGVCEDGFPPGQKPDFSNFGTPWGVEKLTREERFIKGVNAGLDQFGGADDPHFLVDAVREGKLTESRLNESVYRILLQKFEQGLFENAYVDPGKAEDVVGSASFQREADDAQRHSAVLLENNKSILPLDPHGKKVYLYNMDPKVAAQIGFVVVDTPEKADVAIMRVAAPFQTLHPNYTFGSRQHEGKLSFPDGNPDYEAIKRASAHVPAIVTIYLDRPAILTNVRDKVAGLVGNFGISDAALLDVLTGKSRPQGKLPFELPSSEEEVDRQAADVPHDTAHPLYHFGFGLSY